MRKLFLVLLTTLAFVACEDRGPAEKAGEKIDDAMDNGAAAMEDAADAVGDAARDAEDAARDAAEEMKEKVEPENQ